MFDIYKNLEWIPALPEALHNLLNTDNELNLNVIKEITKFKLNGSLSKKIYECISKQDLTNAENSIKILIVSNNTYDFIVPHLSVACLRNGLSPEITVLPYGDTVAQLLNGIKEGKYKQFDYVLIALDKNNLQITDELNQKTDSKVLEKSLNEISSIIGVIDNNFEAKIIIQSFILDSENLFGLMENHIARTKNKIIEEINLNLIELCKKTNNLFFDLENLVKNIGSLNWQDQRMYYWAKLPFNTNYVDIYCSKLINLVIADKGLSKKALILDLDNTLWGGVIGDDGIDGIKASIGDPVGEAFLNFQSYCKRLKNRGVLLCVCSKNSTENAILPFKDNPDMFLKEEDFIVFKANWNNKADNIKEIALELNIGLDSLVFVDDNPIERNLVREFLPEVEVPEIPSEVSYFPEIISAAGYFESIRFSKDDIKRANDYKSNKEREILKSSSTDISHYLKSLEMVSKMSNVNLKNLTRPVQLMLKTNQFNLTNIRRDEKKVIDLINNPEVSILQFRLKDKFAENGIVSVLILIKEGEDLHLDTWVMSCRVFGRTLEFFIFDRVIELAKELKVKRLFGYYQETQKNQLVADLYKGFNFSQVEDDNYSSKWELDIANYQHQESFIASEND